MVKNIKLNTFFFKEYAQITEKNSYSAYIPNGSKGIWCIADFNEKINEKMQEKSEISQKFENSNVENKKIDKINLAKVGVHKIIEKYLENNEFSLENVEQIIQSSIDEVIFEKTKLYKFHKAEKDFDLKNFYSQIVIIIEKNNMIVGNMGKTEFVLYRENRIVEKISGEQVKKIRLKKHDYLLAGSPGFWKVVNESEIEEIYVDRKSKLNVEQNLSEQIKASEKKLGKVIPFLSIFVEDIEMEKNYELLEKEINEKNQKQEKVVKYMFLAVIFVFMFVSVGKNIQKGNFKGERKEKVKNIMAEKILEKANLMKNNLSKRAEIEMDKVKQKNIENEEIEKNYVKNLEITQNIIETKEKGAEKLNNSRIKKKVSKNKKYNRKNLNADNRNFKKNYKVKSNRILQLEKEIEKNWEVLGRDRNGNNFG
ncbi:hypothetical protein JCM16775_2125 [Leptotrichia hofstadii]|uniref:Uncharacterized protein n=1 Tax=Leptotrichia hofstadii TaxID=157688 RepID=A0A510JJE9_9FUSO|nr:hypothetical protein [Leptotrichia hofstadii]BBM39414.1 hypothetical protein JCM16775_2125 [Leptotrichia hofstadii]